MSTSLIRASGTTALALVILIARARGQCTQWIEGHGVATIGGSFQPTVYAQATFDDGSGPALYVGGSFEIAGSVFVHNIAKWDGHHWSAFGGGVDGTVRAMLVDQGVLYIAGDFTTAGGNVVNRIARWNGSSWSALGAGFDATVRALAVFDDGSGPKLFAGGEFSNSGALSVARVARWDGISWSSIYSGSALGGASGVVHALAAFNGSLYAGGSLPDWNGVILNGIARWTGNGWAPLAQGLYETPNPGPLVAATVFALCVWDDGGGPDLYVGGTIDHPGGQFTNYRWGIARWDGTAWSTLKPNVNLSTVQSLASFGPALYLGGPALSQGMGAVTKWNGTNFSTLPYHLYYNAGEDGPVNSLWVHDDGTTGGPTLFIGGFFERVGYLKAESLVRWTGSSLSTEFEPQVAMHVNGSVVWDDGSGPQPLLFGNCAQFGTDINAGFARLVGTTLQPFTGTTSGTPAPWGLIDAVAVNASSGNTLYTIFYPGVWATQGASWSVVATSSSTLNCLASFDSGSGAELYVAGAFISFSSVSASHIVKRDSAGAWLPLGSGVSGGSVYDMQAFDDGTGPSLYVAGTFTQAGGLLANGIARWNGSSWSTLGSGASNGALSFCVSSLCVHDDGTGPALYALGAFTQMGGVSANGVARWNGTSWSPLGNGVVLPEGYGAGRLASFDDGSGPRLYAAGIPASVGSFLATCVRWDGATWQQVGPFDDSVYSLAPVDAVGTTPARLFFGGYFTSVAGVTSVDIAEWSDHSCPLVTYCTAAVSSQGCVASITGSGTPSASALNGFTVRVATMPANVSSMIFYGINGAQASTWGSGYMCVQAPRQRTPILTSSGTAPGCDGQIALDWNAFVATHPSCLGAPFSSGTSVWAQGWYRDPASTKTTQLSDGLRFIVSP